MPINFSGIKTTKNRKYRADRIAQINDALQDIPIKQRAAILGSIIEESGGEPLAESANGTYQGLLQWGHDRYTINPFATEDEEFQNQLSYIRNTINNTSDKVSWTHGGDGSGYNSYKEAYADFTNEYSPLDPTFRAFSFGYVRPKGKTDSYQNRLKVAQQVYDRLYAEEQQRNSHYQAKDFKDYEYPFSKKYSEGGPLGTPKTWDNLSMTEKSEMMRVAIENGITTLPEIKEAYNQFANGGGTNTNTYGDDNTWTLKDEEGYNLWRSNLPKNLSTETNDYDLRGAYKAGIQPILEDDGYYRLGSRDPKTGRLLKTPSHPTMMKALISDAAMGYYPRVDEKGNIYTDTWKGNLFSGEENHSSQIHQGYVYDVLPKMLKEAGLNVRVTSGYRRPGQAGKAGNRSWHVHHGAVDIVPQGKTTFEDIENVLYNNPVISRYMIDNGFGLLDESGRTAESKATMKKTGATGAHFHIGKDSKAVSAYNNKMSSIWDNNMSQLETAINQPTLPVFMPSNPQAFFAPIESYQRPVIAEEPLVQTAMENPYSPEQLEREERAQGLRNLGLAMSIMRGGQEQSYSPLWEAVSMLSGNQMAKGGKIHIKPENRGKFTALKKRTGHSATWFKQHGTPAQRKMATFALNAKKWKHSLGGHLFGEDARLTFLDFI